MITSLKKLYFYFFESLFNFIEYKRPEILYFNADTKLSNHRDSTILRWHVRHVNKVTINGVSYPSKGEMIIENIEKSKFTLKASNKKDRATSEYIIFENPYLLDYTEKQTLLLPKTVDLISKAIGTFKNINHSEKELSLRNIVLLRKNRQMEISKEVYSSSKQIDGTLLQIDKEKMEASWQQVQEDYQV